MQAYSDLRRGEALLENVALSLLPQITKTLGNQISHPGLRQKCWHSQPQISGGFPPPQTLAKMFVSTIATGWCFFFFIKSKQSSTNNYGISWLLFFRRESLCGRVCKQQLWDGDAWCCDSGSDHCPLSSETWHWTLRGQSPPRQLPPAASALMIQQHPGVCSPRLPSLPFFPPFSSPPRSLLSTPSFPISLIFSLSRPSVLSRAPCVTRIIKTNTDLILVSNPVVLFFLLTGPGACWVLGVHSHTAPPPGLFLDFKQSGASHMVGKE